MSGEVISVLSLEGRYILERVQNAFFNRLFLSGNVY